MRKLHTSQGSRDGGKKRRKGDKGRIKKMTTDFDIQVRNFNYVGVPKPNHIELQK